MSGVSGFSDLTPENEHKVIGGTDNTTIGNTGDRLKVDASFSSGASPNLVKSGLRVEHSNTEIILSNSVYTTIYEQTSEEGKLYAFFIEFSTDDLDIKLEIDGIESFNLNFKNDIEKFSTFNGAGKESFLGFEYDGNKLQYKAEFPIYYSTSFKISAKAAGPNKKAKKHAVSREIL